MAGMKRFVTYIYSYENKKKGSNIGFAKIEIRGEDCRIEIHLRGVYAVQSACRVYLFRAAEAEIEGVFIGNMKLGNGNGDFAAIVKAGKIGDTPFGIADLEGIFLMTEDERIFMSRWKEGKPLEVSREHFREWQLMRPDGSETADNSVRRERTENAERYARQGRSENAEGNAQQENAAVGQRHTRLQNPGRVQRGVNTSSPKNDPVVPSTPDAAGIDAGTVPQTRRGPDAAGSAPGANENADAKGDEENVQATEIPMRSVFPEYNWTAVWESLRQSHTVFSPFESRETECIQIELKDLRELPKRYWYLGNNSFLLHGFFNYRYLVVGKTPEDRWFLGVPGIYQRQERVMAAIFGFPEFIPAASEEESAETAGEPVNRFGCWFRYIEE